MLGLWVRLHPVERLTTGAAQPNARLPEALLDEGYQVIGELGRGGRYIAGLQHGDSEPATGLTLFMDTILKAVSRPEKPKRIFIPAGTKPEIAQQLRSDGLATVTGLTVVDDHAKEAQRLGCTHLAIDGNITEIN